MASPSELREHAARCRAVAAFVASLPDGSVVVSGGAPGVDTAAADAALARGLSVRLYEPDYGVHSRDRAQIERNTRLVAGCDELHAWASSSSSGAWDSVRKAQQKGIPVTVHRREEYLDGEIARAT